MKVGPPLSCRVAKLNSAAETPVTSVGSSRRQVSPGLSRFPPSEVTEEYVHSPWMRVFLSVGGESPETRLQLRTTFQIDVGTFRKKLPDIGSSLGIVFDQ